MYPDWITERPNWKTQRALSNFRKLIDYPLPSHLGNRQTTQRIKAVKDMLARRGEYKNLTPVVKGKWTKVLEHNMHDVLGMQTLIQKTVQITFPIRRWPTTKRAKKAVERHHRNHDSSGMIGEASSSTIPLAQDTIQVSTRAAPIRGPARHQLNDQVSNGKQNGPPSGGPFRTFAHVLSGKPVPTFPGYALSVADQPRSRISAIALMRLRT